jgi:hypothetical protein
MTDGFSLDGIEEALDGLDDIEDGIDKAAAAALWQGAQEVHRDAATITPVQFGHLKDSYVVDKPKIRGNRLRVLVGYSANYALWVHERTELNHKVGDAKFLTRAIDQQMGDFANKLAKRTAKNIKAKKFILPGRDAGPDYDGGVS